MSTNSAVLTVDLIYGSARTYDTNGYWIVLDCAKSLLLCENTVIMGLFCNKPGCSDFYPIINLSPKRELNGN